MVGFAVVGLGMGKGRARMIQETEGAELSLVIDTNEARAAAVGMELGVDWAPNLEDGLGRSDVDVVMVMTPSGLHADLGCIAAAAGKHVITTKPMDVSTRQCDRLIAAADSAGVKLAVDYQSRYVDTNYRVARAIELGYLGRPLLGEVRFKWFRSQGYFEGGDGWRGTWAMDGGGSLANQGSHLLDLLLWFMGAPERLYAETAILTHDIETEDLGMAIIHFRSGAKGAVLGTTTFPGQNAYFSAEVHGTDGGVLIDEALDGTCRIIGEGLEERMNAIDNPLESVVADMVYCLQQDGTPRIDGREGRRTVALLEDIYRSSREGTLIDCIGG